jgi:phosphopantetheinyl transferase (holo-ACP synthase)
MNIGIDIIEVKRIKKSIENERFLKKSFFRR